MGDGHLGKCKVCTRNDAFNRTLLLRDDPVWIEKERIRSREKYHRLGYKERQRESNRNNKWKLRSLSSNLRKKHPLPKGLERHHWSYSFNNIKDVIVLNTFEHKRIHVDLTADPKRKIFKTKEGKWLDTKRKHLNHIKRVLGYMPQYEPF